MIYISTRLSEFWTVWISSATNIAEINTVFEKLRSRTSGFGASILKRGGEVVDRESEKSWFDV